MSRLQSDLFHGQERRSRGRIVVILALVSMASLVFVGLAVGVGLGAANIQASNHNREFRMLYAPNDPNEDIYSAAAQAAVAQEYITPTHDLVIVLDRSSSMAFDGPVFDPVACNATQSCHPFEEVRNNAVWLVNQLNFPYDRVALVAFSRRVLAYDPAVNSFRQLTETNDYTDTTLLLSDKNTVLNALSSNSIFNIDTCVRTYGCYDNDMPGLGYTANTNAGGAIRVAASILAVQGRPVSTTWTMLFLTDGSPNATDPIDQFTGGFCPPTTWSFGSTYTVPGYLPNQVSQFPYAYPYCRRANVSPGAPPNGDPDLPYNQISRACFYTVTSQCKLGTTITDTLGFQYDAADYMRDQADYMGENGIAAFVIGLGPEVSNDMRNQSTAWNCDIASCGCDCSRDRNAGERLLRYVADVGSRPNTWECHSDYWTLGQTEVPSATHCGNYWFAANGSSLPPILAEIANRITTTAALPLAAFVASPLSGTLPLTVYFTDTSTGTISSWLWQFGDGVTCTLQHPTHTYILSGAFTVTLQVSGPGGTDTVTRTNAITVYEPMSAAFAAFPTSGYRPLVVTFTNQSMGDYISSLWNFGDNSSSVTQNPTHTYDSIGVYTVSLQISGPSGMDTLTRTNYIAVSELPPVADFAASPLSGPSPLTVYFTDASTGTVSSWLWQFGDGLTSMLSSPMHTYDTSGAFTVTLNVYGPGGSDWLTRANYITVYESVLASFSASPLRGVRPLTVTFTNQSTGDYISSLWSFGDGMTSTLANPLHTYVAVGVYTISLVVSGPGGSSAVTRTNYITVTEPSPVAGFTASPLSGTLPLTVYFTDTSTGTVNNWLWQFGDGLTSTLPGPTHTYNLTGTFDVTLMVTGPGGSDLEARTAYISVRDRYVVYLPFVLR